MPVYTKRAVDIFAPTDAGGAKRSVLNGETQVWGTEVERSIEGAAVGRVDTVSWSNLSGIAGERAGQPAIVYGPDAGTHTDPVTGVTVPNEGIYAWSASPTGWRRVGEVPSEGIIHAANTGAGTPDAAQATTIRRYSTDPYTALFSVNFIAPNSGPMTLSINGETPRPIVTNTGEPLPADYVQAGMATLVQIDEDGAYRLFSYGDADAVLAAVEAWADEAKDARDEAVAAASAVNAFGTDAVASGPGAADEYPVGAVFETKGRAVTGDGGGGRWIVEDSDPGSTLKLDLNSSGKFARSLERVLRPEQFGVLANTRNQQQGFIDLAAELRWRGGGRVEFPDYRDFNVFDDADLGGVNNLLMDVSNTRGVKIALNGSRLLCDHAFEPGDGILNLIYGTGVKELKVFDLDYEQTANNDLIDTGSSMFSGTRGIYLLNESVDIEASVKMKGGHTGFGVAADGDFNPALPARHMDVKLDLHSTYYGLALSGNGSHVEATIHHLNSGRAVFANDVHHIDLDVTSRHGGPFSDVVLKGYARPATATVNMGISHAKVRYRTQGRWKIGNEAWPNGMSLISLEMQQLTSTPVSGGGLTNIDIDLEVSLAADTLAQRYIVVTGKFLYDGQPDTTGRQYLLNNINISGNVYKPDDLTGGAFCELFTNTLLAPGDWTDDQVSNISVKDLYLIGTAGGADININAAAPRSGLVLANVYAPWDDLHLGTPRSGVLDASRQVNTANFKSKLDTGLAAGNSGYQRLPNGRVEMYGVVNAGSNANTAVTFPLTISQVERITLTSMVAGEAEGINAINISTTGFDVNATSAWDGGNVAWSVVARI